MMFRKTTSHQNWHDYVEARLSAYIDGELPDVERSLVRKHLNECDTCQASLDSLGWTIKLLKQLPAPSLPRQFTLPVPEHGTGGSVFSGWLRWGLAAGSAVAVFAIVFIVAVDLLRPGTSPSMALAPAASQPEQTMVAFGAPTASGQDTARSAGVRPTSAPVPAVAPTLEPAPAVPPLQPVVVQGLPPTPTAPAPTETQRALTKSAAPAAPSATPSCQGCGGGGPAGPGVGGESQATGTPGAMMSIIAAGPSTETQTILTTGLVRQAVNVRAEPSLRAERLGALYPEDPVEVLGRDTYGLWLEILFHKDASNAVIAWVVANYIGLDLPLMDLPVVSPPPTETPTPTPVGLTHKPPRPHATSTPTAEPGGPDSGPGLLDPAPTPTPGQTLAASPPATPSEGSTLTLQVTSTPFGSTKP